MNHYLFKYSSEKIRDFFINKRITSVSLYSSSSFSIEFKDCRYILYANLSSQKSFLFPINRYMPAEKINDTASFVFLKKKLPGLVLKSVKQNNSERTVYLFFDDIRGSIKNSFVLIFEMIDRLSNAVFTDESCTILQAYKYIDASRTILPHRKYKPPDIDMPDILSDDLDKLLFRFRHGEDILGFNGALKKMIHKESEFINFVETARKAFKDKKFKLYLYGKKNIYPFLFSLDGKESDEDFIFDNFILKPKQDEFENRKNNLKKIIAKRLKSIKHRMQKVDSEFKNAENAEKYRVIAENLLIHPNLNIAYKNEITIKDIYSSEDITIQLNSKLSLFNNAQNYFKKFKRSKKSKKIVKKRLKETKRDMEFAEQLIFDIENAQDIKDLEDIKNIMIKEFIIRTNIKKHKQISYVPYKHMKIMNFDVYIGKNARGNDYVTLKLASKNDLWFHPQGRPGAHLILKNPSRLQNIDDNVKMLCAEEVAKKTKAAKGEKVDVDYTFVKYVKKPKSFKTGLVIYSNFKTLRIEKK